MISFAIPGDLNAPTGGYGYARSVLAEWRKAGIAAEVIALPAAFPFPADNDLAAARDILGGLRAPLLIDGLAYGAFDAGLAAAIGPETTVLLHHPLCDETGLDEATADKLFASEKLALSHARNVVVTSPSTGRALTERFGVAPSRITVAVPGLRRADAALLAGDPPHLLAVGSLTRRKGYRELIAALADLRDLPWTCDIYGSPAHDPAEAKIVAQRIESEELSGRITLKGTAIPQAVWESYAGADIFVTASHHEGYGMAAAEAAAHGLPIVAARGGALVDTVPCAEFVPVGDANALGEALRGLLRDPERRRRMGAESHRLARTMPDWAETARLVAAALETTP